MAENKAPKSAIVSLSDLKPGDRGTFFALLCERNKGATRDKKEYYSCRFRDARRIASLMVWLDGGFFPNCDQVWKVGQCFKIQAIFNEHERYGPQIDIIKIRPVEERDSADGFRIDALTDHPRKPPAEVFSELRKFVEGTIELDPVKRLVVGLLDKHAESLQQLPADHRKFYLYPGGWLDHVLAVCRHSCWLTGRYRKLHPILKPPLNRDLVIAAAALHEIGRVGEIVPLDDSTQVPTLTVDGRLLGHHVMGRDLVRDAAREQGDVPPEFLRLLEHVLLSYLAIPEWGSPRLPLIPEALILHHADDLDAKMEMYVRCLTKDSADGPFTERDVGLGKQLYKGREV